MGAADVRKVAVGDAERTAYRVCAFAGGWTAEGPARRVPRTVLSPGQCSRHSSPPQTTAAWLAAEESTPDSFDAWESRSSSSSDEHGLQRQPVRDIGQP